MRDRWFLNRATRGLLALYPGAWRTRYGREFAALLEDEPLDARVLLDVTGHCLRQRFSPDVLKARPGSSPLRPEFRFRFPRALVFLMTVAFSGVMIAIRIASKAAGDTTGAAWITLGSVLFFMLLSMCVAAAIAQGILRCLRRSGLDRLESMQSHNCSEESNQ